MKSIICSDIHDHIENLVLMLSLDHVKECDSMLICGDICSPFVIDEISNLWNKPVHLVFGNNDGDRISIAAKVTLANANRESQNEFRIYNEIFQKQKSKNLPGLPENISIAMNHYPVIANDLAASGNYDFVFYGHSHISSINKTEKCKLVNPGTIMGYIPGKPSSKIKPSFALIDWDKSQIEIIEF